MIDALKGKEHYSEHDGKRYCFVPVTYHKTLGEIVDLLEEFRKQPQTIMIPEMPNNSFEKKLYATYLSYLPPDKMSFPLRMNTDERGCFTELLRTAGCGQFSINICKPGVKKGQHWHHTKWELFIVVSGHGLIQERRIGIDESGKPYPTIEFEVSGDKMEAVYILPGYTHNIINLSDTEDLITVMWANEQFDAEHPDTFLETV
jgi:UDP-2-acetamido-2,6-beta-L-arabino-hexul-4-ose reductase